MDESRLEKNKALYRSYIDEVFNRGRIDRLGAFLAATYVYRDAPPGSPHGPESVGAVVRMFRAAFPDLNIAIEDQVAEGDKVCSLAVTRGTHQGPFLGIPPTHKSVSMTGITMVRIVDNLIVESWVKNDVLGLLRQLGATTLPR